MAKNTPKRCKNDNFTQRECASTECVTITIPLLTFHELYETGAKTCAIVLVKQVVRY